MDQGALDVISMPLAWRKGFEDGQDGRPCAAPANADYRDGWITGDTERDMDDDTERDTDDDMEPETMEDSDDDFSRAGWL